MKLIALILGLGLERLATRLLHLRELRWFDPYFDAGLRWLDKKNLPIVYVGCLVLILAPMIPVLWASMTLMGTGIPWDLPYLLFAVLVVFFCLGPRDLGSEVEDYCEAMELSDEGRAQRIVTELSEVEHSGAADINAVEEAIFVQATNRFFGVMFWFILLGPVGAWLFRVSDLMRRRVAFVSGRDPESVRLTLPVVDAIHGVLVWIPARLAAIGYALSGNFDDAFNCWRSYQLKPELPFHRSNDELVACVGKAAMTGGLEDPQDPIAAARRAMQLVNRTLFIWVTVLAVMTLYGWSV